MELPKTLPVGGMYAVTADALLAPEMIIADTAEGRWTGVSYDLRFAVKVAGHDDLFAIIGEPEYHSPTYNIGKMFRKCTGWDFEQSKFYRLSEVLPKIEHGIEELRYNEKEYEKYNSPNGYGDTDSAYRALTSIVRWIRSDWNGLKGSWNADIPLEDIWIAW